MAYVNVDLTLPIALLVGAIVGVMVVRTVMLRGEARAKERTKRLLARHGLA